MRVILIRALSALFVLTAIGASGRADEVTAQALRTDIVAKEADSDFKGLGFGVGLSLTIDGGKDSRVDDAELVDGIDDQNKPTQIVRVKSVRDRVPRVMLESHYFFEFKQQKVPDGSVKVARYGLGPFVSVQPGSNEIIDAIGMGVMFGMRRSPLKSDSFNVAVGYVVDPRVKILGDGIEANKPLPPGETQIRYKTTSQSGILILFSFAF